MNATMTERFGVAGALLVKLFGRPEAEAERFSARAARVRDIGVQQAMYGTDVLRGDDAGRLAGAGADLRRWAAGSRCSGTDQRRHRGHAGAAADPPVRADHRAVQRAGQRHERAGLVRAGLRGARPGARRSPRSRTPCRYRRAPSEVEFRDVRFRYPSAAEVSLASLEDVATLDRTVTEPVLRGVTFTVEPGQMVALVGPSGAGKSTTAMLVPRVYDVTDGAVLVGDVDVRDATLRLAARHHRRGHPGRAPVPRDDRREPALRPARGDRRGAVDGAGPGPGRRPGARPCPTGWTRWWGSAGYRFSGGEKQRIAIARLLLKAPVDRDPRRGHGPPRQRVRGGRAAGAGGRAAGPHRAGHRAPALHRARRRPDPRARPAARIVERGTHEELVAAGGLYADLYRTQFAVVDSPPRPCGRGGRHLTRRALTFRSSAGPKPASSAPLAVAEAADHPDPAGQPARTTSTIGGPHRPASAAAGAG